MAPISSVDAIVLDRAYQRIIGLGPAAVPLILEELQRQSDHWFWALTAITGEDPAAGADSIDEAATLWVEWGRRRGYVA